MESTLPPDMLQDKLGKGASGKLGQLFVPQSMRSKKSQQLSGCIVFSRIHVHLQSKDA